MFKSLLSLFSSCKDYEKIQCPVCYRTYIQIKNEKDFMFVNKCGHLLCSDCFINKILNYSLEKCGICRINLELQKIDTFTCSFCKKFNIIEKNYQGDNYN